MRRARKAKVSIEEVEAPLTMSHDSDVVSDNMNELPAVPVEAAPHADHEAAEGMVSGDMAVAIEIEVPTAGNAGDAETGASASEQEHGAEHEPPESFPESTEDALVSHKHEFADVLPFFKGIDGWLAVNEAELLFTYAKSVTEGCIVEVGSYRGRSTSAICAGVSVTPQAAAGEAIPVYAIDPHEKFVGVKGAKFGPGDRKEFFRTMVATRLVKYVRLLNLTSPVVTPGWETPVAMLFLDGDHRYATTRKDFDCWWPHLIDGAKVLFANADDDGPSRVIREFSKRGMLSKIQSVGKISAYKFTRNEEPPRVYPKPRLREAAVQKNLDIDTVAYNVYYGGGGQYMYQAIPKCACTTIKTILLELEGLPVDENEWRRHQKDNNLFPGADWMNEQQRDDLFQDRTSTFKFVIVRDPYTRLVSAYKDKIRMETKLRAKHWLNIIRSAAQEQGVPLSVEPTFEEFVHVVSQQPVEQMDSHWRQQYFEGRFGLIKFNYVGHVEKMNCDLPYILEQLDAPEHLQKRAAEQHNVTGAQMAIWDTVSPEIRQKFMKAFEIDFDTLCYPYRTPRNW